MNRNTLKTFFQLYLSSEVIRGLRAYILVSLRLRNQSKMRARKFQGRILPFYFFWIFIKIILFDAKTCYTLYCSNKKTQRLSKKDLIPRKREIMLHKKRLSIIARQSDDLVKYNVIMLSTRLSNSGLQ